MYIWLLAHFRKNKMEKDVIKQLQQFKLKDKFPIEDWDNRGLIPSPVDVRDKMNQEINKFIDFVVNRLKNDSVSMTDEIQTYLDEWDSYDFDTEETEYVVDTMCEVMRMVDVDINDILI